ncbi:hypothetical protein [Rhodopirellula bahusiensis]|uniref:hypothetical protein n=1 Tax=Rhodopirellula bahusiensis TaxID=2014065 RepID=UPI003264CDEA
MTKRNLTQSQLDSLAKLLLSLPPCDEASREPEGEGNEEKEVIAERLEDGVYSWRAQQT